MTSKRASIGDLAYHGNSRGMQSLPGADTGTEPAVGGSVWFTTGEDEEGVTLI